MSFFGAISQLGRLLPGYVQGERMANEDNWKDIFNYNKDVHEMMQNAFDYSSFKPQLANVFNRSRMLDYSANSSFIDMIAKQLNSGSLFGGQMAYTPEETIEWLRKQRAMSDMMQQAIFNSFPGAQVQRTR